MPGRADPVLPRRALLAALVAPAAAPGLLGRVMAALAAVPHRRALFTETKTLAALAAPLRSSGRLGYDRPDRFDKVTDWPRSEVLSVHGARLSLRLDGGPARRIDLTQEPAIGGLVAAILGTLSGNLALLRHWYHARMTGTAAAWILVLTPRDAALARLVARVTITGSGGTVAAMRTVAANGDRSVMTIQFAP